MSEPAPTPAGDPTRPAIVYDFGRSPACQRVRIALALKGIPYRRVHVDLPGEEQSRPEHLERNPQGLVPVLEIDGLRLTQSLSIIEYLEETRPTSPLLPLDPRTRAAIRRFAYALAAEISPLHNLLVSRSIGASFGNSEERRWLISHLSSGIMLAETMLQEGEADDFCFGSGPTLADCVLVPQVRAAWRWGVDCSGAARVAAVMRRCASLSAFRDVIGETGPFSP